ncbi:MAG: hypothetical protein VXX57_03605 [Cyanobacteriota bacterium]|nr:hypothetical protein [Cyanobacteriota bacterium]
MTEPVPEKNTSKLSRVRAETSLSPVWEYKVIHINMNSVKQEDLPKQANPEVASEKLQGSLSPEFIKKEFPDLYKNPAQSRRPRHPAEQLQDFLNEMGRSSWELIEISELGPLQMFFFKRLKPIASHQPGRQNRKVPGSDASGQV